MELSLDLPNDVRGGEKRRSGGNVSVGRSAPQVVPHSLTHTYTKKHSARETHSDLHIPPAIIPKRSWNLQGYPSLRYARTPWVPATLKSDAALTFWHRSSGSSRRCKLLLQPRQGNNEAITSLEPMVCDKYHDG